MTESWGCVLVVVGADEYGRKELLAMTDGVRESTQSCAHSDTSDQVFRRHMISHSGVSDHPEMTPSGAVW